MNYDELIADLRFCADTETSCSECKRIGTVTCEVNLHSEAADAIEELTNKLCDWCGVCPKERRKPYECEIMFPDTPVPEVWIDPPKPDPCEGCRHYPPSSMDGKPCTMCDPDDPLMNCREAKEDEA